jgi:hypothetical protein
MSIENPTLAHFRHFSHFRHSFNYNIFPDTLNYAKQTQCQVRQKQLKLIYNNDIQAIGQLVIQKNKAKTNPIQTQYKPNSKPIPPAITPPATLMIDDGVYDTYNDHGHYRKDL